MISWSWWSDDAWLVKSSPGVDSNISPVLTVLHNLSKRLVSKAGLGFIWLWCVHRFWKHPGRTFFHAHQRAQSVCLDFFPLSLPSSLRPLVPPRVCPVLFRSVAYLETWQAERRRQLLCGVVGGKDKESSTAHIWVPWVQRQRQQLCYKNRFAIRDSQQRESQLCWQQGLKQPFFFSWRKDCSLLDCVRCSLEGLSGSHPLAGRRGREWKARTSPEHHVTLGGTQQQLSCARFFFFFFPFSFSFSFFFSPSLFFSSFSFFLFFFSFSLRWGKRHPGDRKLICKISEFC